MNLLKDRLKKARKAKGMSQEDLAKAIKRSQSTIAAIETGRNKESTSIVQIAQVLGVSPLWLETGQGDMYAGVDTKSNVNDLDSNVSEPLDLQPAIPLISSVQAGTWAEIIDNFQPGDADEWLNTTTKHSGSSFALKVSGESMKNPGSRYSFDDGDIILVDPEKPYHNGSLVVVRLNGDKKATFKKLIIEEGKMYLKALNPDWPDPIIPMTDEAQVCGVVFEKIVRFP